MSVCGVLASPSNSKSQGWKQITHSRTSSSIKGASVYFTLNNREKRRVKGSKESKRAGTKNQYLYQYINNAEDLDRLADTFDASLGTTRRPTMAWWRIRLFTQTVADDQLTHVEVCVLLTSFSGSFIIPV